MSQPRDDRQNDLFRASLEGSAGNAHFRYVCAIGQGYPEALKAGLASDRMISDCR